MVRKTRKQKIHRTERIHTAQTSSVSVPVSKESPTPRDFSLTKEEQLTNAYFKADFTKSFLIIAAIIATEIVLYYTNFGFRLLGK